MTTDKALLAAVGRMAILKFFPSDQQARIAIMELMRSMCGNDSQVRWLAERMSNGSVFNEWPGPHELRAVYCSKFRPSDGIEAGSVAYAEGIPSERPQPPECHCLPAAEAHALLAEVAEDAGIQLLPSVGLSRVGVKRIERKHPPPLPESKRITAEDIEREKQRLLNKLAAEEIHGAS